MLSMRQKKAYATLPFPAHRSDDELHGSQAYLLSRSVFYPPPQVSNYKFYGLSREQDRAGAGELAVVFNHGFGFGFYVDEIFVLYSLSQTNRSIT